MYKFIRYVVSAMNKYDISTNIKITKPNGLQPYPNALVTEILSRGMVILQWLIAGCSAAAVALSVVKRNASRSPWSEK